MPVDRKILERVRALLNTADPARGATAGEQANASSLAKKIMERYKLTTGDIPANEFSARGRYYQYRPPPRDYSRPRPHYDTPPRKRRGKVTAMYDFTTHETYVETSKKVQSQGILFHAVAEARGYTTRKLTDNETKTIKWIAHTPDQKLQSAMNMLLPLMRTAYNMAVIRHNPSNPNAFQRAFYEEAGYVLSEKLRGRKLPRRRKAKNEDGIEAGRKAAVNIDLFGVHS